MRFFPCSYSLNASFKAAELSSLAEIEPLTQHYVCPFPSLEEETGSAQPR